MKASAALAARIRRNEAISPPLAAALSLASLAQRAGMWWRLRRPRTRVFARVISFGNLTAGGVGKTPAVIERACRECASGRCTAVITRGFGAKPTRTPIVLPPGENPDDLVECFGDEAALIARRAPQVWIVRSPNRVAGALAAISAGCEVLLLDDGFQAVTLERDENILLIDATNPFGNGRILPRGLLREPLHAMARATEILLTRCDQAADNLPEIEAVIQRYAPGTPLRRSVHQPTHFWRVCDDHCVPLERLRGAHVRMVSGIGNPEAFASSLDKLGIVVTEKHLLPDHAPIPVKLLDADKPVILTEKDAVRLRGAPPPCVHALAISLVIEV